MKRRNVGCKLSSQTHTMSMFFNGENYIFVRPYIFMRFLLWSLTFIFTAFSSHPKKRISFLSMPLHQRQKMHTWQMENAHVKM